MVWWYGAAVSLLGWLVGYLVGSGWMMGRWIVKRLELGSTGSVGVSRVFRP